MKKPKTEVKSSIVSKLENSLLALKVFGGVTKTKIPLVVPDDEARLAELEMVFNQEHDGGYEVDYEKEAKDLLQRYNNEIRNEQVRELRDKLAELDESDEGYETLLRQIRDLQNQR